MNRPRAIDLFCGAGGLSLGLEQAGFDVVAAVDSDPINCATHEYNFPHCPTVCRDINELTGIELRRMTALADRQIDLVAGGPPCQSFSQMGKRQIDDERSNLIFEFARLVMELQASYFIMENVPALATSKTRLLLSRLIDQFSRNGYLVRSHIILNAANYGVPQNRNRLFVVGCRRGMSLPTYPLPLCQKPPTVADAIGDLPEVSDYPELLNRDWVEPDQWYTPPFTYAASLRWDTDKHFGYSRRFNPTLLTSSQRSKHTAESRDRFAKTPPGSIEPVSHFHKLNPFALAPTLRAGTGSDRGSYTAPRPIHPHQPRCITVREGARMHSYPDWFRFHATIWHGFRQLGNSVPPPLARAIASEVIYSLNLYPCKPDRILDLGSSRLLELNYSSASCQQLSLLD